MSAADVAGAGPSGQAQPASVDVFVVEASEISGERLVPAVLSTEGTAIVLAKREGTLVRLKVQEGARVDKGKALAQLDEDDTRIQLQQARLEFQRTQVEAEQTETSIKVAQREYERHVALSNDGLVSRRDLDQAKLKLENARYEAEKIRVGLQIATAKIRTVQLEAERAFVRAPISGFVTRSHAKLGSTVQKGEKLFEVSQLGPLQVRFQLPQTIRTSVGVGSVVSLSDSLNGRVVAEAQLRNIDAIVDPVSNSRTCLADVVESKELAPGMAVNVHIPLASGDPMVLVPRAVFPAAETLAPGSTATLFVVVDGICRTRTAHIDAIVDDRVQLSSGIGVGDRIVLAPPVDLRPGDSINVLREITSY